MIGNALNVSRHTVVVAVAGNAERSCASRPFTKSSACTISVCQVKNTFTSADPRPVLERTETAPGRSFIASSMGRVTAAIISSAGITPLSTRMTQRGKSVLGKTDDGMRYAE